MRRGLGPTSGGRRRARRRCTPAKPRTWSRRRLSLVEQPEAELTVPPPPPAISPLAPVPHQPPEMGQPPQLAPTGNAYVDTLSAPPSKQAMELWGAAGDKATTEAAADQARF